MNLAELTEKLARALFDADEVECVKAGVADKVTPWESVRDVEHRIWRSSATAALDYLRSLADDPESGVRVVEAKPVEGALISTPGGLLHRTDWAVLVSGPGRKLVLDWEEK